MFMVVFLLYPNLVPRCCGAMESDLGVVAVTANDRASAVLDATSEMPTFLD
jgi:hypothetical protein